MISGPSDATQTDHQDSDPASDGTSGAQGSTGGSSTATAELQDPLPPVAWQGVLTVIGTLSVALLALSGRYGYHRDELYFRVAGHHPDWGYVDQPPLIPLFGRVSTAVFGDSPAGLRVPAVVFTAITVLLAALVARELGGDRTTQTLTAVGAATGPYVLASGHMLSTGTADLTIWIALIWATLRVLRTEEPRWWLLTGAVVGVGVHFKHLVGLLVVGLLVGLLAVGPRRVLLNRWLWAGGALAVLLALPNLVWQAAHDWPQLEMADAIAEDAAENRALLVPFQAILAGVVTLPVWVVGLVALARRPAWRRYRAVAVAYPVTLVVVLLTGGQYYYTAPLLVTALAAGFVVLAGWLRRRDRRVLVAGLAVVHIGVTAVLSLPLLPKGALRSPVLAVNETGAEQIGWPELAATVGRVYRDLSDEDRTVATIFTSNYGEAGALDRFGGRYGLPQVHSSHNSYYDWGAPQDDRTVAIIVGRADPLLRHFGDCQVVAHADNGLDIDNEEQGAPIRVCRAMTTPWSQIWPTLRHLG